MWLKLVMEKSPVISKARALGLARALKLITRAFLGFADPIDFTNVMDLISLYTVLGLHSTRPTQYHILFFKNVS